MHEILAELKRRQVFKVAAWYGGLAFAILQGADLIVDGLGMPRTILTALTILTLVGFPVALVIGWVYELGPEGKLHKTAPAEGGELEAIIALPRHQRWPAGIMALVGCAALLVGSWLVAIRISPIDSAGRSEIAYAVEDPRGSYLVLPFSSRAQSADERDLAERAAARLTRQLRGWETIRVVPEFAVSGMLYDLGVDESTVPSMDLALQMARNQRVGTLVGLAVNARGDSAQVEATLYDVGEQREVSTAILGTALVADISALVAPVAQEVLNLRDQHVSLETLRSESANPQAHQEFDRGLDALYDWRLAEAEQRFRDAIVYDSLFALPHHYLGLTLYWQTARDPQRILDRGPEIARLSRAASRLAQERGLRPGLREHVEAFRAFWEGDYESARSTYRAILGGDTSDSEAWLLLGAVEFSDPELKRDGAGSLIPRQDLNLARRAFETTARLSPDFQLSYGHLFDIDRRLAEAALLDQCFAFQPPGGPHLPPYVPAQAADQVAFCPILEDSVKWIRADNYGAADRELAIQGAERLQRRTQGFLERWVGIQPEQPRPREELADWLVWRRSILSCSSDASMVDRLTSEALEHRRISLELRGDTTPEDRVRLAVLTLASGNPDAATALVEQALQELTEFTDAGPAAPTAAANVFLATGRPNKALEILTPVWSQSSFAVEDPVDESFVMAGDVTTPVGEVRVRGATGDDGPALAQAIARLGEVWSSLGYTPRQQLLLREGMLGAGIQPGLALRPELREDWFAGWSAAGEDIPPVWQGLLATAVTSPQTATSEEMTAVKLLDEVLVALENGARPDATSYYLAGILAQEVGQHSKAVQQFARVEACPLRIGRVDLGWGLRSLSRLHRARSLAALGDSAGASEALAGFATLWTHAEPAVADLSRR